MKPLRPYHFARAQRRGFAAYYQAIVAADGIVCFDFEDSIRGADQATTLAAKQAQRRRVRGLLQDAGLAPARLAVRLNAPNTPHYAADLRALRGLPGLHAVFVPKAEDPAALRQVLRELPLPVRHVVPVVETQAGFAALPALLALPDPRLDLLAFGHCDYNLSCGHFPFFHQDAEPYWGWLAALDAHAQAAGKRLLNSPVLQLADAALFAAVLHRLRGLASAAGQITLCLSQTLACRQEDTGGVAAAAVPAGAGPECAQGLVRRFEQASPGGGAFAVDAQRRLISPHEYAAARRLLA